MAIVRTTLAAGIVITLIVGCSPTVNPAPASAVKLAEGEHGHKPSVHGGMLVSFGKDQYHAEAVFETGGKLRLYMLGAEESIVFEVERQTLAVQVKVGGVKEVIAFELKADPQPGDQPGKASQFVGDIPAAAIGKIAIVTIPGLRIGGERYRIAFNAEVHPEPAMPAKLASDDESKLFLNAGGLYTEADIQANGRTIPSAKFKGLRAEHDNHPKPGDVVCPITQTKANPKFVWVIGGKSYEFCCTPCIEEFVILAKEKPGEIKDPKDYVKK